MTTLLAYTYAASDTEEASHHPFRAAARTGGRAGAEPRRAHAHRREDA